MHYPWPICSVQLSWLGSLPGRSRTNKQYYSFLFLFLNLIYVVVISCLLKSRAFDHFIRIITCLVLLHVILLPSPINSSLPRQTSSLLSSESFHYLHPPLSVSVSLSLCLSRAGRPEDTRLPNIDSLFVFDHHSETFSAIVIPLEQENSMTNTPPNILLSNLNRPDQNCSVHAEPSTLSRTNVSPCLGDDMPDQPRPTSHRASILHQSLRPITLKVRLKGQLLIIRI